METSAASVTSLLTTGVLLFLPPLLDSVERKVRAKIQSRIGPPTLLQTWYDLIKLCVKELKIPASGEPSILLTSLSLIASITALYLVMYSAILLPSSLSPITLASLLILITASHSLTLMASATTSNPFAVIGSYRGVFLALLNEFGIISGSILAIYTGFGLATNYTLSNLVVYLLSLSILLVASYVGGGRLPFDIHEAEPELASGVLIEFSGKLLALYIYVHLLTRYVLSLLVSVALITPFTSSSSILILLSATVVTSLLLYVLYGVTAALLGRTRVDIGIKSLLTYYAVVLIALVIFTWIRI
ncbi:MAG: NADH-quinone oxidoreductase subunit H [Zestosphaera sp.]